MTEGPSLTERLAARLVRPVPQAARDRARLHLLDWLGCVAGARGTEVAAVARAAEPDPMTRAALLGNLLEMDDVDRQGRLHPGPVVWPAAICAVRDVRGDMGALLDAGARGYEAMIAVGRSLDDHHYAHWHPTATAGGFGAAAAAGSAFGFDAERHADTLGHAGSLAGGLWRMRQEDCHTKAIHAAQAALTGLWHARLVKAGARGPRAILEGAQGVHAAMTRAPRPMPQGDGWLIGEVSFKPYGACRHAHPAIDAALALPQGALADGPIRVETYRDALTFCDRPEPASVIDAKFSLQHAVAVVAVRGAPQLADFEPTAIADPAIAAVRARVAVAEDPGLTAAYPAHFGARVIAGDAQVLAPDALGDPERPVGRSAVVTKLRSLVAWGGLEPDEAKAAEALILDGDPTAPIDPILDLIGRWTA